METLVGAIARFRADGFPLDFSASADGQLTCGNCGVHGPESMTVHAIVRFEGDSNPDDESILVALESEGGCRGLFTAAFGLDTPMESAEVLHHLLGRPQREGST